MGGEPEEPAQQLLLDEHAPLHAELLKVPHHGAATSLPEFFQAVDADVAVICVGQPNDYGHPVPSTLQAIAATGAQIWRTDQHGDDHGHVRESGDLCTIRAMSPAAKTASVTLLWGEDEFLLRERALGAARRPASPRRSTAGEWQGDELQDLATPSLFGEPRALLIADAKSLPKEALVELAAYLAAPDPDAPLVICAQVGDRAKVPAALDKLVKPVGQVLEVKIARKDLEPWLLQRAKRDGVDITPPGGARPRGDPRGGAGAARRRAPAAGLGVHRPAHDAAIVAQQFRGLGEQKVWDLCDRAFGKDLPGAIRSWRSIEEGRDDALMILGGIATPAARPDEGPGAARPDAAGGAGARGGPAVRLAGAALPASRPGDYSMGSSSTCTNGWSRPTAPEVGRERRRGLPHARHGDRRELTGPVAKGSALLGRGRRGDLVRGLRQAGLAAGGGALVDDALRRGLVQLRGTSRGPERSRPRRRPRRRPCGPSSSRSSATCGRPCSARPACRSAGCA